MFLISVQKNIFCVFINFTLFRQFKWVSTTNIFNPCWVVKISNTSQTGHTGNSFQTGQNGQLIQNWSKQAPHPKPATHYSIEGLLFVNYNTPTVFDLITAHAPISAQSSNLVVFTSQPVYFYLILYKNICCGYSFKLPWQVEAVQIRTYNICFYKENQKIISHKRHYEVLCWSFFKVCSY